MHKPREILRLKRGRGLSNREAGRSVKASPATVSSCLLRANAAGLSRPLPEAVDDAAPEALLYPRKGSREDRPEPDFKHIHRELKRKGSPSSWCGWRTRPPTATAATSTASSASCPGAGAGPWTW